MKTKERSFYILIIIATLSITYYFSFYKDYKYVDIYKKRIEQLDSKVDSLNVENKFLEEEADSLFKVTSFLNKEIYKQDKLINDLEKETNEKIYSIDTISSSGITKFFTDRYGYDIIRCPSR